MRGERTVSVAAREAGISLGQMHYYVTRFQRAGLLQVVRELPRHGRAVKVYRAVSRSFRIPVSVLPMLAAERFRTDHFWNEAADVFFARAAPQVTEVAVALEPRGTLMMRAVDPGEEQLPQGAFRLRSAGLFLSAEEARELGRELNELYRRYEQRSGPQRYGLRIDVLPVDRPVDLPE